MNNLFAEDIKKGLSAKHKYIPDRDYYDDRGSLYFQELMAFDDYYVTKAEYEIFETFKTEITKTFGNQKFNLIEFGAGDGFKTKILINELVNNNIDFNYIPIDFSKKYIEELEKDINAKFPNVNFTGLNIDYFDALSVINKKYQNIKNVILFIGSSFGGLSKKEAYLFLEKLYNLLNSNDLVLIGFDLKKSPKILHKAYHSSCKNWCFYLLERINKELNANFDYSKFEYYTCYNAKEGKYEWYFLSTEEQCVEIKDIDLKVRFDKYEEIFIGQSKKFTEIEIKKLSSKFNFKQLKSFYDTQKFFTSVIWEK